MNVSATFHDNPSSSYIRNISRISGISVPNFTVIHPMIISLKIKNINLLVVLVEKSEGSPKSVGFILSVPPMSVQNFTVINLTAKSVD